LALDGSDWSTSHLGHRIPLLIEEDARWAPEPVRIIWKSENLLPLLGFESRTVQSIASFDTDYIILAPSHTCETFTNFSPPNTFETMIEIGQNEESVTARWRQPSQQKTSSPLLRRPV